MRDVLRIDAAALLANGVGDVHEQRARACRGVVATHVANRAAHGIRHQDGGHDFGHGMGRVVLGVFAATVFVVVLDEIFKQRGVKVVLLAKDALKAEVAQLVDDGPAKSVSLGGVGDEFADPVKQGDLGATIGFDGKDVVVGDGNVAQRVVKQFGKLGRVLAAKEVGNEVLGLQAGSVWPHLHLQHFSVIGVHGRHGGFPAFGFGKVRPNFLGLECELVVEEFVEKNLGDDLEFVAIIAQAIRGANGLEAVDEFAGALFKLLGYQGCAPMWPPPVRWPAENSFMYSATTRWLMARVASGVSWMCWRV